MFQMADEDVPVGEEAFRTNVAAVRGVLLRNEGFPRVHPFPWGRRGVEVGVGLFFMLV